MTEENTQTLTAGIWLACFIGLCTLELYAGCAIWLFVPLLFVNAAASMVVVVLTAMILDPYID